MKTIKSLCIAVVALTATLPQTAHAQTVINSNDIGPRIMVLGAVTKQGIVRLSDPTVLSALAESSGWVREADLKRVTILRRKPDGATEKIVVNVAAILNGQEGDVKLQRGDVLHVPEKLL